LDESYVNCQEYPGPVEITFYKHKLMKINIRVKSKRLKKNIMRIWEKWFKSPENNIPMQKKGTQKNKIINGLFSFNFGLF